STPPSSPETTGSKKPSRRPSAATTSAPSTPWLTCSPGPTTIIRSARTSLLHPGPSGGGIGRSAEPDDDGPSVNTCLSRAWSLYFGDSFITVPSPRFVQYTLVASTAIPDGPF